MTSNIDAYRTAENIQIERVKQLPGLVRANGSQCLCCPPNRLWVWWYNVHIGDRWYCKHGGGWKFVFPYSGAEYGVWREIIKDENL